MSDLFDDLDFEMLGGDFEDPFENEPVARATSRSRYA
jgi:hypothetical protein